jgi:hypothetical protein
MIIEIDELIKTKMHKVIITWFVRNLIMIWDFRRLINKWRAYEI